MPDDWGGIEVDGADDWGGVPLDEERPSLLSRAGMGIANIPGAVSQAYTAMNSGIDRLFGVDRAAVDAAIAERGLRRIPEIPKPFDVPEATTGAEFAADLPGVIGSEVAALAAPGGAIKKGAGLLGLGRTASSAASGLVQGLLSGVRQDGAEAATQGAEFAAGNVLTESLPGPGWLRVGARALMQGAVPAIGQGVRSLASGEDYDTKAALLQGGAQALLGSGIAAQLFRKAPSAAMAPEVIPPTKGYGLMGRQAPELEAPPGQLLLQDATPAPIEQPPARMLLRDRGESGATSLPIVSSAAGGAGGALFGYATGEDDESRAQRAVGYGLLGAGIGALPAAKIGTRLNEASRKLDQRGEMVSGDRSAGESAIRFAQTNFNLGRSNETLRALEKGLGTKSRLLGEVDAAWKPFAPMADAVLADPAAKKVGDTFLDSPGLAGDIAALDASPVPTEYKDALKTLKSAQREGQMILASGEKDLRKRALYGQTMGTFATRAYRIFTDPKAWQKARQSDPAVWQTNKQAVVDQWQNGPLKGMDRADIERSLDSHLAELERGQDPVLSPGESTSKISQSLYTHRRDFKPDDWDFLDNLSRDPNLPAGADSVLAKMAAGKTADPSEQAFLGVLAKSKKLAPDTTTKLRELAAKEILTKEYRSLLGEIDDPMERQFYTLNKIFGSVAQAKTFKEILGTKLPDGRPMAMNYDELRLARGSGKNTDDYRLVEGTGYGALDGKYVPRDAADALKALVDKPAQAAWMTMMARVNSWAKEAVTVLNPGTQIRQALQTPFFLAAARVNPADLPGAWKALRDPKNPLWREMQENRIIGANFAQNDLLKLADGIVLGKKKGLFTKAREKARELYSVPDDFVRASAYISAKKRFGGDIAKAVDFVNQKTMNYGQVANAVKVGRNIPVVSPFVSFTAEMSRLTKNLFGDLSNGSAGDKIHAGAALAMLYAAPLALKSMMEQTTLTADERKEWSAAEGLMPSYQRSAIKIPFGRNKDGSFRFSSLGPWTPAGDLISGVRSALKGDVEAVVSENPIFGFHKSPLASAAIDAISGTHHFTQKKLKGMDRVERVSEAVLPPWLGYESPDKEISFGGFAGKKLFRGFNEQADGTLGTPNTFTGMTETPGTAISSLLGLNIQGVKPASLRQSQRNAAEGELREAQRVLSGVMRRNPSKETAQKARAAFQQKREKILKNYGLTRGG